ncbi:MAG: nitrile hydratase accessory protein [Pseudomonadota bacterium]
MNPPEPERPFEAPWHADLFATTHALARAGAFKWTDWADAFGAALANADAGGAPKDGSTYYEIWLGALEQFLSERGLADPDTLAALNAAWRDAYLSTPHGEPVSLD